jgi:BirA family biotin operon repressor/biotin-[acetyl-CoA-carboxylase] ligase
VIILQDDILRILLDNQGTFVSGEEISEKLGVSRTTVWKSVRQLKEEGCRIDSVSNKGYCLTEIPDRLSEVLLRRWLTTDRIGQYMELHHTIGSTNARAKELAQEGAPHGTLVAAEEQASGRGRLGRSWVSPPGMGIWMSIILRPSFLPSFAPRITVLAAMAAADAVNRVTGLKAGIKWPNDIIISAKKVCGILTEMQADPDQIEFIVVGIGTNVNIPKDGFPTEISGSATSLFIESGTKVDRNRLLADILGSFEALYNRYEKSGSFSDLLADYKLRCITLNRRVRVVGRTEEFTGTAIDLTDNCELIVRLDDGTQRTVLSGDVSVRGIAGYV